MDLNDIRIAVTVIGLLGFLGIVRWAYARSRSQEFERVARSVLEADSQPLSRSPKESP